MASTNKTPYFGLSQFIGTDKPTWLGDVNGDMLKIDTQMQANKVNVDGVVGKADQAISLANQATENVTNLAQQIEGITDGIGDWITVTATNPNTSLFTAYFAECKYNPTLNLISVYGWFNTVNKKNFSLPIGTVIADFKALTQLTIRSQKALYAFGGTNSISPVWYGGSGTYYIRQRTTSCYFNVDKTISLVSPWEQVVPEEASEGYSASMYFSWVGSTFNW